MLPPKRMYCFSALVGLRKRALLWLLSVRAPALALLLSKIGEGVEIRPSRPTQAGRVP